MFFDLFCFFKVHPSCFEGFSLKGYEQVLFFILMITVGLGIKSDSTDKLTASQSRANKKSGLLLS